MPQRWEPDNSCLFREFCAQPKPKCYTLDRKDHVQAPARRIPQENRLLNHGTMEYPELEGYSDPQG